jgi:hypothetical protein
MVQTERKVNMELKWHRDEDGKRICGHYEIRPPGEWRPSLDNEGRFSPMRRCYEVRCGENLLAVAIGLKAAKAVAEEHARQRGLTDGTAFTT